MDINTIELQKELIERITATNDVELLNSIKMILDFKKKEPYIYLTAEEEEELLIASKEAKEGHFVDQMVMDKKVEEWLKEK
jgi:hypothetical protein